MIKRLTRLTIILGALILLLASQAVAGYTFHITSPTNGSYLNRAGWGDGIHFTIEYENDASLVRARMAITRPRLPIDNSSDNTPRLWSAYADPSSWVVTTNLNPDHSTMNVSWQPCPEFPNEPNFHWNVDPSEENAFFINGAEYTLIPAAIVSGSSYGTRVANNPITFTYDNERPTISYDAFTDATDTPPTIAVDAYDAHTGVAKFKIVLYYDEGGNHYWQGGNNWSTTAKAVDITNAINITGGALNTAGNVSGDFTFPTLTSGRTYYYRVVAFDRAENYNLTNQSPTHHFYYDTTPPQATLILPDSSPGNICSFTISGSSVTAKYNGASWIKAISGIARDSGSGLDRFELFIKNGNQWFNGTSWVGSKVKVQGFILYNLFSGEFTYTLPTAFFNGVSNNDTIQVQVEAWDRAGNDNNSSMNNFKIDNERPTSTIDTPSSFSSFPWQIHGTVSDNFPDIQSVELRISRSRNGETLYWGTSNNGITFTWSNDSQSHVHAAVSGNSWSYTAGPLFSGAQPDDIFTVNVRAIDAAGNTQDPATVKVLSRDTTAPFISITFPVTHFNEDQLIDRISTIAIDDDNSIDFVIVTAKRDSDCFIWPNPQLPDPYTDGEWVPEELIGAGNIIATYGIASPAGNDVYAHNLPPAFFEGLVDGSSFVFAAAAVNTVGIPSEFIEKGPIVYDNTLPTNPSPSSSYVAALDDGVRWQNTDYVQLSEGEDFSPGEDPIPAANPEGAASGLEHYNIIQFNIPPGAGQTVPDTNYLTFFQWAMPVEGIYTLSLQSIDKAGNTAEGETFFRVGYDHTDPTNLSISFPSNGSTIHTMAPIITWNPAVDNISQIKEYKIYCDGILLGSTAANANSFEMPAGHLTNGSNIITVVAYDNAGNSIDVTTTFAVQTQSPPAIEISSPANGSEVNTSSIQIQGSASDDSLVDRIEISVNGGTYTIIPSVVPSSNVSFNHTVNNLESGEYTISVRAYDDTGLYSVPASVTVSCDTDDPTAFGLIYPEDNGWAVSQPTFEWEASTDASSGLKGYDLYVDSVKVNTETITDTSYALSEALADGEGHEYYVIAEDNAGNTWQSATFSFQVDGTPPTAFNLTAPAEEDYIEAAFEVAWTGSSDQTSGLAAYEIYIDEEKVTETSDTSYHIDEVPADGSHTIYVLAKDVAGNTTQSNTVNFVTNVNAPAITLYVNDKLVEDGDRISTFPRIKAELSDASGIDQSSIKITIDSQAQGNTSLQATETQPSSIVTAYEVNQNNVKLEPGKHTIKIEVKDIHGKTTVLEVKDLDVLGYAAIEQKPMNYPNPFRPSYGDTTKIHYTLTDDADIKIMIYDLAGRQVNSIFCIAGTEGGRAGANNVPWDGKNISGKILGNGVYVYIIVNKGSVLNSGEIAIYE